MAAPTRRGDTRVLSATLQLEVDKQAKARFQSETSRLTREIAKLQQQMETLKKTAMLDPDDPFLQGKVTAQLKKVGKQTGVLVKQFQQAQSSLEAMVTDAERLQATIEKIASAGAAMQRAGTGLLGGGFAPVDAAKSMFNLTNMMDKYLGEVGMASEAGRRWVLALDDVEEAQLRIGETASEALVPWMEKVAEFAEKGAEFVEKHPDVVKGIVTVGGILVSVGTLTSVLAKGVKMFGDAKLIAAAFQQKAAADTMLQAATMQTGATGLGGMAGALGGAAKTLGTVALMAGSVYIGGELGGKLADVLGPLMYGEESWQDYRADKSVWEGAFQTIRDGAATLVGVGGMIGKELGLSTKEGEKAVVDLMNAISGVGEASKKTQEELQKEKIIRESDIDAYVSWRRKTATAEDKYRAERADLIKSSNEEILATEKAQTEERLAVMTNLYDRWQQEEEAKAWSDYLAKKRMDRKEAKALEDHQEAMADAEEDFQDKLSKSNKDFQKAETKTLIAHHRAMDKMEDDYNARQEEAVRQRDAVTFLANMRAHKKQKEDAEEEFGYQREERAKEQRERIAEMKKEHQEAMTIKRQEWEEKLAEEEAEREFERGLQAEDLAHRRALEMQAAQERVALLEEQHAIVLTDLRAARDDQLTVLREAHTAEKEALSQQLYDRLFDEKELRAQFYADMEQDLVAWMGRMRGTMSVSQYQAPRPAGTRPGGTRPTGVGRFRGRRQMGGYTDAGLYQLHGGEFVLNPSTTSMLERLTGGSLTQGAVTSNRFVSDQSGWQVGAGADPAMIKRVAYEAALEAYIQVNQ